jgi:hypothetical protein
MAVENKTINFNSGDYNIPRLMMRLEKSIYPDLSKFFWLSIKICKKEFRIARI